MAPTIHGQILLRFNAESLQNFRVIAFSPARCVHIDRFINSLDTIFFFEPVSHNVELQLAHCADNNIVIAEGEKHLGAALL